MRASEYRTHGPSLKSNVRFPPIPDIQAERLSSTHCGHASDVPPSDMSGRTPWIAAVTVLCGSCSNQVGTVADSLVGATNLPSAEVLASETLYVTKGANDWGGDRLSYELKPDGLLIATHSYLDGKTFKEEVRAKDTVKLDPNTSGRFQRLMWRVRPEALEGQGFETSEVRPVGCERRGPHDFGEVGVAFVNEGVAETRKDDRIGVFELPQRNSCTTKAANLAREAVREALQLLPRSRAVEGFENSS